MFEDNKLKKEEEINGCVNIYFILILWFYGFNYDKWLNFDRIFRYEYEGLYWD